MDLALALHTAARRYCMEQYSYWCEQYSEISRTRGERQSDGYNYTEEALATFPRYNVLKAIRAELESIDPEKPVDSDSMRSLLVLAGQTAEDVFTRPSAGSIESIVIAEEREKFCRNVSELKPSDLESIEPLPYQRSLSELESESLWARVRPRWKIQEGYWYPLSVCELPGLLAFDAEAFEAAVTDETLHAMLAARGIGRVFELREDGQDSMIDLALLEPSYNGAEGYWISNDLDWIIYASHESSITVGGWLLNELKSKWPSWESHLWTGGLGG